MRGRQTTTVIGSLGLAALAGATPGAAQVAGSTQPVQPGRWEVTSTVVELAVPGLPGFIRRMATGRSRSERKQIAGGQGVEALLAPDPKARCRIVGQHVADGRYQQTAICPQKKGELQVERAGSYDANGFAGRAVVSGNAPKGAVRIVLDQKARRTGA